MRSLRPASCRSWSIRWRSVVIMSGAFPDERKTDRLEATLIAPRLRVSRLVELERIRRHACHEPLHYLAGILPPRSGLLEPCDAAEPRAGNPTVYVIDDEGKIRSKWSTGRFARSTRRKAGGRAGGRRRLISRQPRGTSPRPDGLPGLNPFATKTRDAAGVFPPPSAATRRGGASAHAPGGSRPNGPAATPPGPSPRAQPKQHVTNIGPWLQAMTLRSRQDREQHRRTRTRRRTP